MESGFLGINKRVGVMRWWFGLELGEKG